MRPRIGGDAAWKTLSIHKRRLIALGFGKEHEWMTRGLGQSLGSIRLEALEPCGQKVTSAAGFELLCTYNWINKVSGDKKRPTIYVPGEAATVVHRELPLTVPRSKGIINFRDANAAYSPRFPLEPMLRALQIMKPNFSFKEVDLLVNRNSLSNLFRFTRGTFKSPFRLNLAMVNSTLVITPLWETTNETSKKNYGRAFERAFTRRADELANTGAHYRSIRYPLGPINMVLLYEADAQVVEDAAPASMEDRFGSDNAAERALFDKTILGRRAHVPEPRYKPCSIVERKGQGSLSSCTAEMVTSIDMNSSLQKKKPQLWLGRTPHIVRSIHQKNRCVFTDFDVRHSWPHLEEFEEKQQEPLQKLVSLIKMLRDFAADSPYKQAMVIGTKNDKSLRVFGLRERPLLPIPEQLRRQFWGKAEE